MVLFPFLDPQVLPLMKLTRHNLASGHIAKLLGMPRHARYVGQGLSSRTGSISCCLDAKFDKATALKWLSPDANPPVPWHRVLASNGTISSRGPDTDGAERQRQALEAEGVEVTEGRTGELHVNLRRWGWFPAVGSIDLGILNQEENAGAEVSDGD